MKIMIISKSYSLILCLFTCTLFRGTSQQSYRDLPLADLIELAAAGLYDVPPHPDPMMNRFGYSEMPPSSPQDLLFPDPRSNSYSEISPLGNPYSEIPTLPQGNPYSQIQQLTSQGDPYSELSPLPPPVNIFSEIPRTPHTNVYIPPPATYNTDVIPPNPGRYDPRRYDPWEYRYEHVYPRDPGIYPRDLPTTEPPDATPSTIVTTPAMPTTSTTPRPRPLAPSEEQSFLSQVLQQKERLSKSSPQSLTKALNEDIVKLVASHKVHKNDYIFSAANNPSTPMFDQNQQTVNAKNSNTEREPDEFVIHFPKSVTSTSKKRGPESRGEIVSVSKRKATRGEPKSVIRVIEVPSKKPQSQTLVDQLMMRLKDSHSVIDRLLGQSSGRREIPQPEPTSQRNKNSDLVRPAKRHNYDPFDQTLDPPRTEPTPRRSRKSEDTEMIKKLLNKLEGRSQHDDLIMDPRLLETSPRTSRRSQEMDLIRALLNPNERQSADLSVDPQRLDTSPRTSRRSQEMDLIRALLNPNERQSADLLRDPLQVDTISRTSRRAQEMDLIRALLNPNERQSADLLRDPRLVETSPQTSRRTQEMDLIRALLNPNKRQSANLPIDPLQTEISPRTSRRAQEMDLVRALLNPNERQSANMPIDPRRTENSQRTSRRSQEMDMIRALINPNLPIDQHKIAHEKLRHSLLDRNRRLVDRLPSSVRDILFNSGSQVKRQRDRITNRDASFSRSRRLDQFQEFNREPLRRSPQARKRTVSLESQLLSLLAKNQLKPDRQTESQSLTSRLQSKLRYQMDNTGRGLRNTERVSPRLSKYGNLGVSDSVSRSTRERSQSRRPKQSSLRSRPQDLSALELLAINNPGLVSDLLELPI